MGTTMGFGFESTTDDVLAGIDLTGRHVVVTGASTGLGEETVRALADHGASVTLAVRDVARGRDAAARIEEALGRPFEHDLGELNLASLASVREFAQWYGSHHDRIDVLINNAGIMACPFRLTVDGFEMQWGTNHLGHFLLTNLLLPQLRAGTNARVVSLSSRGHVFGDMDLNDPGFERTEYEPFAAYGRSKTANALFAVGFDQRFAAEGMHAYGVHPGGIHTKLGRHMTTEVLASLGERIEQGGVMWKTIPQGAATSVWAATAAELADHGGAYLEDCGVAQPGDDSQDADLNRGVRRYAVDPNRSDQLWSYSTAAVGLA
jgi:NAD(P)-dependent dehydrogenase (short-subunit alcohol dehydrogenase family)